MESPDLIRAKIAKAKMPTDLGLEARQGISAALNTLLADMSLCDEQTLGGGQFGERPMTKRSCRVSFS